MNKIKKTASVINTGGPKLRTFVFEGEARVGDDLKRSMRYCQ
jgi:hypothetical protein